MEVFTGLSLRMNAPEIFSDDAFVEWLNNTNRKFTWHKGGAPDEWSDVVVLVDPGLTGEGSDSDMPEHIWNQIVDTCRNKFGSRVGRPVEHITVRLTNVE